MINSPKEALSLRVRKITLKQRFLHIACLRIQGTIALYGTADQTFELSFLRLHSYQ